MGLSAKSLRKTDSYLTQLLSNGNCTQLRWVESTFDAPALKISELSSTADWVGRGRSRAMLFYFNSRRSIFKILISNVGVLDTELDSDDIVTN